MSPEQREDPWDFTPVLGLLCSLSFKDDTSLFNGALNGSSSVSPERSNSLAFTKNGTGHAGGLGDFDRIWEYRNQPSNVEPPDITSPPAGEYIEVLDTNGIQDVHSSPCKAVKWRDECEGADLADNDQDHAPKDLSQITKIQRKKIKKETVRQHRREEALARGSILPSGSEDEPQKEIVAPRTPNRKSVIDEYLHGTSIPHTVTGRLRSGKEFRDEAINPWPIASPQSAKQALQILGPKRESAFAIAAAKKAKLIAMLTETFIDDRPYLTNISFINHVSINAEAPVDGIHIFVDASNIMIGFHDALKLSRGQSIHSRMRRQPLSFHNFSLILERGRPSAKRIIVGSDNFPAISEAKAIGYEINILDRVHKAKELTPRQKKYTNNGNGNGTGTGSGSETTAAAATAQYAPEKWVEQAVDEILHLKMMESVVDASEPSTMVLATGDAAEAEYSAGFLKMVERALGKGWSVELACFRHNMSGAYKRKEFRQKWGGRFKIVELDGFVEVLLGDES